MLSTAKDTIIFIGHYAGRTGAPVSLLRIVQWIASNTDHKIVIILNAGGPLVSAYEQYGEVFLWRHDQPQRCFFRRVVARLRRAYSRVNHPIANGTSIALARFLKKRTLCVFNNTGVNGHILQAIAQVVHVPVVSRIPELEAYMRKNNLDGSVDLVLSLTNHFVAVSNAVKLNLIARHGVAQERTTVVYGSCDTVRREKGAARLREHLGLSKEALLVGGCGTMEWRKGIDLFMQVARLALQQGRPDNLYFCWVGGCVSANSCIEYKWEVELLGIADRVLFLGEVEDTAPFLADFDIFLLTSREDPFPLVVLEAARQALPIVCFEGSGGAQEFVDDSIGVRVPFLDVVQMSQAVSDLAQDTERRAKLGEAAYERSLHYSPEKMGADIYKTLMTVAGHDPRQPVANSDLD